MAPEQWNWLFMMATRLNRLIGGHVAEHVRHAVSLLLLAGYSQSIPHVREAWTTLLSEDAPVSVDAWLRGGSDCKELPEAAVWLTADAARRMAVGQQGDPDEAVRALAAWEAATQSPSPPPHSPAGSPP